MEGTPRNDRLTIHTDWARSKIVDPHERRGVFVSTLAGGKAEVSERTLQGAEACPGHQIRGKNRVCLLPNVFSIRLQILVLPMLTTKAEESDRGK